MPPCPPVPRCPPTCSPTPGPRRAGCPRTRGCCCTGVAGRAAALRTGAGGRVLLRQVGGLPRRSRAGGRWGRLHRRPPPRLGGDPARLGAPRPRGGRPGDRADGLPAVPAPHPRGGRSGGRRGPVVGPSATVAAPLAHPAVDALHRRRPCRRARAGRLRRLGALADARRRAGDPRRLRATRRTAGRRRTRVWQRALASGAFAEPERVGSLRVLTRVSGEPATSWADSAEGQPQSTARSSNAGSVAPRKTSAPGVRSVRASVARIIAAAGVRRVLARPVDAVGVDVAGPVRPRRRCAGAARRRAPARPGRVHPAPQGPAPARTTPRR